MSAEAQSGGWNLQSFGRLLRISLAPSAVADVVVGMAIGGRGRMPGGVTPWFAVAASLLVNHGAMALNDWADREHDAKTRPERPIPSGAIGPDLAFALGLMMVLLGVVFAAVANPATWPWMLVVACLAVGYDLVGRGPLRGPLLLGLCRAGNLGFGIVIAASAWSPAVALPAVIYFLYVFFVSLGGRLEDGEGETDVAVAGPLTLGGAGLLLGLSPLWASAVGQAEPVPMGLPFAWLLALVAAYGLITAARGLRSADQVGRVMGIALRRLLILVAVLALAAGGPGPAGWLAAALALAGFPISHQLRRAFPPS